MEAVASPQRQSPDSAEVIGSPGTKASSRNAGVTLAGCWLMLLPMFRKVWIEVRSSLWFVPALLVLAAIVLALTLVELDIVFAKELAAETWKPLLSAGAEGARGMLTAIAGSMITVAGVAFSITIVTLSLASTQYTPRILRNFMRDRANQFVLGVFVAIFTYCLIVLRTIRAGAEKDDAGFVPLLAVAFALVLALVSIGFLIFFIHHVATSIQASSILRAITEETRSAIEALFPEELGEDQEDAALAELPQPRKWHPMAAEATGYLQHVSADGLLRFAEEQDAVLRLEQHPGEFVSPGTPLVSADCALDDESSEALWKFFSIGDFRTVEQDAGFGIRQIVDIAMKALSPGVNDTSTASSCLDYLGALLCQLAGRHLASPFRAKEGKLRVIAPTPVFEHFLAKSLNEIRHSAAGNVTILKDLLRVIRRVGTASGRSAQLEELATHARLVAEMADHTIPATYDRQQINAELDAVRETLRMTTAEVPRLTPESVGVAWR